VEAGDGSGFALTAGGAQIQPAVLAAWVKYNQPFEGVEKFLYTDAIGLVTTGMGNLVDSSQSGSSNPWAPALQLPWKNPDGSLSSGGDVIAAWQTVKNAWPAVQSTNCAHLTTIRLDDAGVQQAVSVALKADAQILSGYFKNWMTMPADAQMGILSMAWAMGAGFPRTFTTFTADIDAGRYAAAAAQSGFQGVGVSGRIAADKLCFENAQAVVDLGLDPTALYWPNSAASGGSGSGGRGWGGWGWGLVGAATLATGVVASVMLAQRFGPGLLSALSAAEAGLGMRRRAA
jgi:GH24 family phage-related lysozyme (muramidase)